MLLLSGKDLGVPYSLSRWTDVSADRNKWSWFESCLLSRKMVAFNSRTAVPQVWSLAPEDTLGLVFWTKNPQNLIKHRKRLKPYNVIVQMTATGWSEVEEGAPDLQLSADLLSDIAESFKVYWRFSPIPLLPQEEVLSRFGLLLIASMAAKLDRVYVSFLQENDRIPETRSPQEKFDLLNMMSEKAKSRGVDVILCADDKSLAELPGALFQTGICVPPTDFEGTVRQEDCGCTLMADPFTVNEACLYNCAYCYSGDKSLSLERHTTI